MLLSPEIIIEKGVIAERRDILIRIDDILIVIVSATWFAKTAINKELGLVLKTPLNRPILLYVLAITFSTMWGMFMNRVELLSGLLYVLKYIEYFFIYFMVVNNIDDIKQCKRLVNIAFLTFFIVTIIGISQIPSGARVSAPFEGPAGEPNTFGGYLILLTPIFTGILLFIKENKIKLLSGLFAVIGITALLYTQSRASYLGIAFAYLGFLMLDRRHRLGFIIFLIFGVILMPYYLPKQVEQRILYTFQPEIGFRATQFIGKIGFDPSTSERLVSWKEGLADTFKTPLIGHGITGYKFIDAQYIRVLAETGIIGFAAFLWLLYSVFRECYRNYQVVQNRYWKGLILGFLAGYIGLLAHALGTNTFIIIRIMEPFWFFIGIINVLPSVLEKSTEIKSNKISFRDTKLQL